MTRTADEWESPPSLAPEQYIDAQVYVNDKIFQEERTRIFARTWKFACHESEITNPGDYRAIDHAGLPIIVVRGRDGAVRSFLNACSHRGAKLVNDARGNVRNFTCFYHLWGYDTQGRCISITRDEAYGACGLTKSDCGLRAVRTAVKLGMIFVNLDDGAESFEDHVGDAFQDLEDPMGIEPMEVFHLHRVVMHANWKQWHETNMELYHEWGHVVNRTTSVAVKGYHERTWKIHSNGHGSLEPLRVQYDKYKGWDQRRELTLPGLAEGEFRILDLFPNTTVLIRATTVRIDTTIPIAPGVTVLEQRGLGLKRDTPEERSERQKHHNQFWGPFGRNLAEDVLFVESVEEANRYGAARYGIIAREEQLLAQDDEIVRAYYRTWSRYMNRRASDPLAQQGRSEALASVA